VHECDKRHTVTSVAVPPKYGKMCLVQMWTSALRAYLRAIRRARNASTFPVDISADVGTAFGRTGLLSLQPAVSHSGGGASTWTNVPAGEAVIGVLPAPSAAIRSALTSVSATATTTAVMKSPVSNYCCCCYLQNVFNRPILELI